MDLDLNTVNAHRKAIAVELWKLEKANPDVDFSALHEKLSAGDAVLVGQGAQPLDGTGQKPPPPPQN